MASLFGCAGGALAHARYLAEGVTVDTAAMARNIDATRGLVFADAAASLLASKLGRAEAHSLVENAADTARARGRDLHSVLAEAKTGLAAETLAAAFDPRAAVTAAAAWVEPVAAHADALAARLAARA